MIEKLTRCPFCGGMAQAHHGGYRRTPKVKCTCCGVQFSCQTVGEAIARWNRRVPETEGGE